MAGLFLVLAGVLAFIFPSTTSWVAGLLVLAGMGFAVFGAHPLIVGAAPIDYGTRKAASFATGFIDCIGYIGAGVTSVATGFLVDRLSFG